MPNDMSYLGIGKTKYFSSVCYIPEGNLEEMQIWQTERLTRKKNSGAWPVEGLKEFLQVVHGPPENLIIAENRDVETPAFYEDFYDEQFPFYDFLQKNQLEKFTKKFNPQIKMVTHHEAHAFAALGMSPFLKSIIVVMDGAGSRASDFKEPFENVLSDELEECSVFLQDGPSLKLIFKRWIQFSRDSQNPLRVYSSGIGGLYEKASEYIFGEPNSAGKVMGLAPFGKSHQKIEERVLFQRHLDWSNAFVGGSKKDWEASRHQQSYRDLAFAVQQELENDYQQIINQIKSKFPEYKNLILTGGCALNCTNNAKILYQDYFEKVYVLPFPGDDGVGLGSACQQLFTHWPQKWEPMSFDRQSPYWGPVSSVPNEDKLIKMLKEKEIHFKVCTDVVSSASEDLLNGKIIGWFQGRSESGPRALGNRSILVRPDRVGVKDFLNDKIKKRESFRPYGCSVIHEKASDYFEVKPGFDNMFMSYALKVRPAYLDLLQEVAHVDGTSRMQTVRKSQNELFYRLIVEFGRKTNLYCLLNTSLNIMGEPIIESMEDAINFFEKAPVEFLYIGNIKLIRTI
jgi:carbamoyltransferase